MIEFVAINHDDVSASEALYFNISSESNDLETFRMRIAWVRFFHFNLIEEIVFGNYHGSFSILTAAGSLGRPGIVIIDPVRGITKLAPLERLTSRM